LSGADRVFAVLVGALLACSRDEPPPAVAAHEPPVARVVTANDDVRVRRGGFGAWEELHDGGEIGPRDQVQALAHGHATLVVTDTGAQLEVGANTTIRFDGTPRANAVTGHVVARLHDDQRAMRLQLAVPSATLVMTSGPAETAEAAIDVTPDATAVEVRAGSAAIIPVHGNAVAIPSHTTMRFSPDGSPLDRAPAPPASAVAPVALVAPDAGAHLLVHHAVALAWREVAGADRYRVTLVTGALSRRFDVGDVGTVVPIASGAYTWSVEALHAGVAISSSETRRFDAEVRNTPPLLAIDEPAADATVTGPRLRVVGQTSPGAMVEANHTSAVADGRGRFALDVTIAHGLTNVVISTRDEFGNQRRVSRSVLWE
jgi:hypothetical protein